MLTNVISFFTRNSARCPNVISWKHSYNRLNEEYEIAKKKQQALDGLYEKGKISQSTHDSYNNEIASAIAEIQKQQEDLLTKMQIKTAELHNQIKTLEMLLTNYEIQHVTGEIDEDTYTQEINLFNNGLETARRELQTIQDAVNQLCAPTSSPSPIPEPIPKIDAAPAQIPETIEVPAACPPTEVTPSYVVSAPEPVIEQVVEAAPIIETPAPIVEAPVAEAPAEVAAPEPVPVVEAPIIEQPAAPVETPVIEAPVVEAPVVEPPVVEAPAAEAPAIEAPPVEAPALVIETPVIEAPVVEAPPVEITEAPIVEPVIEEPAVVEVAPAAPEPTPIVEEVKVEKSSLDSFEVAEPDVVQKELLQAVEEIAENPFPQAPQEAHEEVAKEATEALEEAHPATLQAAKENLPEASSNNENTA